MKYHLFVSVCIASIALVAVPAHAQEREYTSGLNYTTLGTSQKKEEKKPSAEAPKAEKPKLYNTITPKPFKKAEPAEGTEAEDTKKEEPEEDPTVVIWNKYKDLAAGTAGEDENEESTTEDKEKSVSADAPEKPQKPSAPNVPSASSDGKDVKPAENAFGSIIDEWKTSRDKQREMRSRTFAVPE